MNEIKKAVAQLEQGLHIDVEGKNLAVQQLFPPVIQNYFIDLFSHQPTELLKEISLPVLIINGTKDIQVGVENAENLYKASTHAKCVILSNLNHVLRELDPNADRADNLKTYTDPTLPIDPRVIEAILSFVSHSKN